MTVPAADAGTPHPLAGWLRARVAALRAATQRRTFPGTVEVVSPGALAGSEPLAAWRYGAEPTDHGLRVDVLARLLTDCRFRDAEEAAQQAKQATQQPPLRVSLVHVRPGPHEPTDLDLGWAAATTAAGVIAGVEVVTAVAVSRWGWYDLRTGQQRSWVRLRTQQR